MDTIVVFFHGFHKTSADWNITNTNQIINIQNTISKKTKTININFNNTLYTLPFDQACQKLNTQIIKESKQ